MNTLVIIAAYNESAAIARVKPSTPCFEVV